MVEDLTCIYSQFQIERGHGIEAVFENIRAKRIFKTDTRHKSKIKEKLWAPSKLN